MNTTNDIKGVLTILPTMGIRESLRLIADRLDTTGSKIIADHLIGAADHIASLESRIAALSAPIAQQDAQPVAWVAADKNGVFRQFRAARAEFFGVVIDERPIDAEHIANVDRDWPGLAPHSIVPLYAAPPSIPAELLLEWKMRAIKAESEAFDLGSKLLSLSAPIAQQDAQPVEDARDKWKMVDADCRDGADGLITYHVNAFDEGRKYTHPAQQDGIAIVRAEQ